MSLSKGCGIAFLVGCIALGGISYCGYSMYSSMKREMPLIEHEVSAWIGHYNAGRFTDAYRMADASLTSGTSEGEFATKLEKLKEQFGDVTLGGQLGFRMHTHNGDTTVSCQYDAPNARGGSVASFTLHRVDGWKVSGFQLQQKL